MFCIEIFAGSGKLTAALKALGFRDSFGIDHKLPAHLRSPIIKYDLLNASQVALVQDLIRSSQCIYVHFAPPCGTASRARLIQRRGRWNPPILRTDTHPNGLPQLSGTLLARVKAANQLYEVTCNLAELCIAHNKYYSIENPGRSFAWLTTPFVQFIQKFSPLEVCFHHCRYGSSRRKLTKLLHNVPSFTALAAFCNNDHEHEPWGQSPAGHWRTSEETTYPWDLCRSMAARLATQLKADGFLCTPPAFALQEASLNTMRAATNLQPRQSLPPMVPEFKAVISHPSNSPIPDNSRKLSTPSLGQNASVSIGIHFSPDEFVAKALEIGHPTSLHSFFPADIREVVEYCVAKGHLELAKERTSEMRRWVHLIQDSMLDELAYKDSLSVRRKDVLESKKLLLFQRLLEESGHGDSCLVGQLAEGFDLTGPLPASNVFSKRVSPAAISCDDLRRVADRCKEGMLSSVVSSGDTALDEELYAATRKEVEKGFLIGPIDPKQMPVGATLTRRFGVKQKNKTRPIDDYKASFVNSSVSQTETATVHSVDHIAALVSCLLKQFENMGSKASLCAKTWDLADAYKQIPLSDHAFEHDGYLVVYCPRSQESEVYQQRVLPFGSVASVTAFLRVAHALWKIGTKLLHLLWTSYFDDFFSVEFTSLSRHTDFVISSLFSMLGWKLSADKLIDYHTVCKVLGVEFDFGMSGSGLVTVQNTTDRVEELKEQINSVIASGQLSRPDGERLRGRLQFASGQLFGRLLKNHLKVLSLHLQSGRKALSENTIDSLESIKGFLDANKPRQIDGNSAEVIHAYIDASFEPDGYSGVGGCLYSSEGKVIACFSEQCPPSLLDKIRQEGQQTLIQELEMMALLVAVKLWLPLFRNIKMVAFSDSESVRGSFLKAWSNNASCSHLLRDIFEIEENMQCSVWIERVPSQSNPSDALSRSQVVSFEGVHRTRVQLEKFWSNSASSRGESAPSGEAP